MHRQKHKNQICTQRDGQIKTLETKSWQGQICFGLCYRRIKNFEKVVTPKHTLAARNHKRPEERQALPGDRMVLKGVYFHIDWKGRETLFRGHAKSSLLLP